MILAKRPRRIPAHLAPESEIHKTDSSRQLAPSPEAARETAQSRRHADFRRRSLVSCDSSLPRHAHVTAMSSVPSCTPEILTKRRRGARGARRSRCCHGQVKEGGPRERRFHGSLRRCHARYGGLDKLRSSTWRRAAMTCGGKLVWRVAGAGRVNRGWRLHHMSH